MAIVVPPREVLLRVLPHIIAFLNAVGRAVFSTSGFEHLRVSSWYRDFETNLRVGGHPDSQHRLGLALDIVGPREVLERLLIELRGVGLIAIDEGSHVHVQFLAAGVARGEGLLA